MSDITFTSAACPDLTLQTNITSMRLTDLYHGELNRIGSTWKKTREEIENRINLQGHLKVPSRWCLSWCDSQSQLAVAKASSTAVFKNNI